MKHTALNQSNPYEIRTRALARNHIWLQLSCHNYKTLRRYCFVFPSPVRAIVLPKLPETKENQSCPRSQDPLFFLSFYFLARRSSRSLYLLLLQRPRIFFHSSLLYLYDTTMPPLRTRDTQSRCE